MVKKVVGRIGQTQQQAMGVFPLAVIEPCHNLRVQEFVEKPATVSPFTPVFHNGNIPGVRTDAWSHGQRRGTVHVQSERLTVRSSESAAAGQVSARSR